MPVSASYKIELTNHFKEIFAHATIGIVVTDGRGVIVAANPFALNEFGYAIDELMGRRIEVLIPPRFHERHVHYHKAYTGKPQTRFMGSGLELFAITRQGKEFPVEISLSNYIKKGEQYSIAFVTNIAARKQSEKEIEKLHEELESKVITRTTELNDTLTQLQVTNHVLDEAIAFQKAILDNAGAMIIATDTQGIIKYFNPEAALNLGYAMEEVINTHTPLLFHCKAEVARKSALQAEVFGMSFENEFAALVEKAKRNIHTEEQYTYVRKDGSTFPVLLTVSAIRNKNGMITGFMGVAVDIAEQVKAEKHLRELLEKEKDLSELKSKFVSMASHEFRTPLSTVLSSAYLIEKYATIEDQQKRQRHLERIVSSVTLLTDLLNDFLSVDKIEEGKLPLRLTQFNLQELVDSIIGAMNNSLKLQQVIDYVHEGETRVYLDTSLLKHIVMNLVSNASKFSPEGSRIEVRTVCKKNTVVLSVKDYGMGISKEDQQHLTERFFRGANAGNIQGTGLGLHIVSKYAELMNGEMKCESRLEQGTTFTITFTNKPD